MTEKGPEETVEPNEGAAKDSLADVSVNDKDKRIVELTDDLKRIQAEFENFKKRCEKDWSERSKQATQRLMTDLLSVLDSFDKALEELDSDSEKNGAKAGIQRLHRQFLQTLHREGLKEVKADGKFDPFVHEALTKEEREDVEDGRILEVYQKGYALGQKILRPARVKVAKSKETPDAGPEESDNLDQQTNKASENRDDECQ